MEGAIGKLVNGDDGLPAEDVGFWTKEKHAYLCRYVDMSRSVRSLWTAPRKAGATYIDPFCGPGRAKVRETGEFIDGGAVAAWKKSVAGGSPFTKVYIGDLDGKRVDAAEERLRRLGAPVETFVGTAVEAIETLIPKLNPYGLHFAFLDPFSLEALDFRMIRALSGIKRIDILVHIAQMDLQRNMGKNLSGDDEAFETFAPGWESAVNKDQAQKGVRQEVFSHWRTLVEKLGVWPSTEMKLITGSKNQPLYWLLLAAKHDLAHKFWATASNPSGQTSLL
ncbi:three-Cys-motif partner protein TcmP [Mesorhizobium wenxiniae]|uniref:three-Cys-motif partner protein TcmP n=1 Tax=Mesorhizobium wenxiniae TaxID=2014805 RepID=UPI001FDA1D93|nr:three-Cys-motif partner protein TcmP [Mesorhizobium wenxiniae]